LSEGSANSSNPEEQEWARADSEWAAGPHGNLGVAEDLVAEDLVAEAWAAEDLVAEAWAAEDSAAVDWVVVVAD